MSLKYGNNFMFIHSKKSGNLYFLREIINIDLENIEGEPLQICMRV